jgi:hypothetical protein
MKGVHQIYLFAATLIVAAVFFIQRGMKEDGSPFEVEGLVEVDWQVRHFDEALFGGDSLDWSSLQNQFRPFLQSNPQRYFWQHERENVTLNDHFTNVNNLLDKGAIAEELAQVAGRASALLKLPVPEELYFYISGIDLETPCLYAPSNDGATYAFVGLDNFLGAGYPGYSAIPGYQRALMHPDQIPVQFSHALLSTTFQPTNGDESLLGAMLYYGKLHVATEAFCPTSTTAEVLGFTAEEYAFLLENEARIWEVLVRERLLFSTDMMVRQRLAEAAPFSKLGTAMDAEIPGRVGQFIGYRMIRSYAEQHPDLSLRNLLNIRDARKILRDAQYKP